MVTELLDPYRGSADLRIDDLVHAAAEIIPKVTGPTARYRVTGIPDARTIRYYIQEGLVDRPLGSSGTAALYGYRHLLQLVAIKVLQNRYLPIRRIKEEIEGVDDRQLEEQLQSWTAASPEQWLQSWTSEPPTERLYSTLFASDEPAIVSESRAVGPDAAAPRSDKRTRPARLSVSHAMEFLKSISGRDAGQVAERRSSSAPEKPRHEKPPGSTSGSEEERVVLAELHDARFSEGEIDTDSSASWNRFELHPGIELHVRQGAAIPESPSFLSALASRLRAILEKLKGR